MEMAHGFHVPTAKSSTISAGRGPHRGRDQGARRHEQPVPAKFRPHVCAGSGRTERSGWFLGRFRQLRLLAESQIFSLQPKDRRYVSPFPPGIRGVGGADRHDGGEFHLSGKISGPPKSVRAIKNLSPILSTRKTRPAARRHRLRPVKSDLPWSWIGAVGASSFTPPIRNGERKVLEAAPPGAVVPVFLRPPPARSRARVGGRPRTFLVRQRAFINLDARRRGPRRPLSSDRIPGRPRATVAKCAPSPPKVGPGRSH